MNKLIKAAYSRAALAFQHCSRYTNFLLRDTHPSKSRSSSDTLAYWPNDDIIEAMSFIYPSLNT